MLAENEIPEEIDEHGITYHYDASTDRITFIRQSSGYKLRRRVFKSVGVDIDKIKTETELFELELRHNQLFSDVIFSRIMSRSPNNLENELIKAVLLGNRAKAEAIKERLQRRHTLGLHSVDAETGNNDQRNR